MHSQVLRASERLPHFQGHNTVHVPTSTPEAQPRSEKIRGCNFCRLSSWKQRDGHPSCAGVGAHGHFSRTRHSSKPACGSEQTDLPTTMACC